MLLTYLKFWIRIDMQKNIILDLDGTIAAIDPNNGFFSIDPKKWIDNDMSKDATIIEETFDVVNLFSQAGYGVIVLTARSEGAREGTERWLINKGVPFKEIYMRPDNSDLKDDEYKSHQLDLIIEKYGFPAFALEDRSDVIETFKKKGLFCFAIHRPG